MSDPRAGASVTTAWVIVGNKPLYPLYVWWIAGPDWRASLWTLLALPLFAALPFVPRFARVGLPLVGLADTAFATLAFGEASGVEAFFAPCAALALATQAGWAARALTALTFVIFAGLRYAAPAGFAPLSPALLNLNLMSAAALTAFIGLRFAQPR